MQLTARLGMAEHFDDPPAFTESKRMTTKVERAAPMTRCYCAS